MMNKEDVKFIENLAFKQIRGISVGSYWRDTR